jgi:TetR/AcrR family transcriptional regulator, fatty acid metabolism regulator protein
MTENSKVKSRKDRIIEAALRIFAEKNFQETTIAEISKKAGVSEATVYEHFGTKEELLFAIPEKMTNESIAKAEVILPYIKGAEARIRAILQIYINLYETNPDYSAIILLQLTPSKRFRQTGAHETIRKAAHILLGCIREGIADGTFKPDTNPYLIRSILLGTIEHIFIQWHLQGSSKKEGVMDFLDPFMEIILEGIREKGRESGLILKLNMEDARLLKEMMQAKEKMEKRESRVPRKNARAK